jgi:hypothetical protein
MSNILGQSPDNYFTGDLVVSGSITVNTSGTPIVIGDEETPPSFTNISCTDVTASSFVQASDFKNSNSSFTVDSSGNLICKDLTSQGTNTVVNTTTLRVLDSIVEISSANASNLNSGINATHNSSKCRGLIYNSTDEKYKLYTNSSIFPQTGTDFIPSNYADVQCKNVFSSTTDLDGLKSELDNINVTTISLTDNTALAYEIKEGSNQYLTMATTNGAEAITINKPLTVTDGNFNSINIPLLKHDQDLHLSAVQQSSDVTIPLLVDNNDQGGTYRYLSVDLPNKNIYCSSANGIESYSFVESTGALTHIQSLALTGTCDDAQYSTSYNRAYCASGGNLHTVDVTNPASMSLISTATDYTYHKLAVNDVDASIWCAIGAAGVSRYLLSPTALTQTISSKFDYASSCLYIQLYASNTRLAVITSNGFYLVNISNPTAPVQLCSEISLSGNGAACSVNETANKLYVCTSNGNVYIYDISNEALPAISDSSDIGVAANDIKHIIDGAQTYMYVAHSGTGLNILQDNGGFVAAVNILDTAGSCESLALINSDNLIISGDGSNGLNVFSYQQSITMSKLVVSDTLTLGTTELVQADADNIKLIKLLNDASTSTDELFSASKIIALNDTQDTALANHLSAVNPHVKHIDAPTPANFALIDNTQGYSISSTWKDSASDVLYMANDVSTGAAVWIRIADGYNQANDQFVYKTSNVEFADCKVTGDLTVSGTTTTVNSTDVEIKDNIVKYNFGETGNGVSLGTSGIEVMRGNYFPVEMVWNETSNKWTIRRGTDQAVITDTISEITPLNLSVVKTAGSMLEWNASGELVTGLTAVEATQLKNIDSNTISNTQWSYLGGLNQALTNTSTFTMSDIVLNSQNINIGDSSVKGSASSVNIGYLAGSSGGSNVSIGSQANRLGSGANNVAIGTSANFNNASNNNVCVGSGAAVNGAGSDVTLVGHNCGNTSCANFVTGVGKDACRFNAGLYSVGIGYKACDTGGSFANTISLNASGTVLNPTHATGFFVNPIASSASTFVPLMYDVSNKEVVSQATYGISNNQWGYLSGLDQGLAQNATPTFNTVVQTNRNHIECNALAGQTVPNGGSIIIAWNANISTGFSVVANHQITFTTEGWYVLDLNLQVPNNGGSGNIQVEFAHISLGSISVDSITMNPGQAGNMTMSCMKKFPSTGYVLCNLFNSSGASITLGTASHFNVARM